MQRIVGNNPSLVPTADAGVPLRPPTGPRFGCPYPRLDRRGEHRTNNVSSEFVIMNPFKNITDIKRIIRATAYSFAGFKAAIVGEAAFRQELALFVILAPLGAWLGQTGVERALLIGSLLVVLIVELLNSAVEAVVNRISTERHELSGIAKDLGSAAVFVALALVVVVWALLLVPRFFT